ncbi:hypothetical protein Rs2_47943 [Raphanus sativus]|nr:hypothetical protein Rs2_47943 [Raphanus sativus]
MARVPCDLRFLLINRQLSCSSTSRRNHSNADRLGSALESENHCTSQLRSLIDQVSIKQSRILALEDLKNRQDQQLVQLKDLIHTFESKGIAKLTEGGQVPLAAVVIMACSRADYLQRTVNSVLKISNSHCFKYPLFISQDGSNQAVKSKALSYNQLTYIQHLDFEPVVTERLANLLPTTKLHGFSVSLTDDMEIAPDFFDYFEAAANLMDRDETIMAASSWNDNGQKQFVHDPYALYRSDFFPGLGWMLRDRLGMSYHQSGQRHILISVY